mmetsp:Transcript_65633/g.104578  ORF Transcript_65633/g.104578 Transcript_65633/m.104578 type:complete len:201 (-) Transcript_65633:494-1096(-)
MPIRDIFYLFVFRLLIAIHHCFQNCLKEMKLERNFGIIYIRILKLGHNGSQFLAITLNQRLFLLTHHHCRSRNILSRCSDPVRLDNFPITHYLVFVCNRFKTASNPPPPAMPAIELILFNIVRRQSVFARFQCICHQLTVRMLQHSCLDIIRCNAEIGRTFHHGQDRSPRNNQSQFILRFRSKCFSHSFLKIMRSRESAG